MNTSGSEKPGLHVDLSEPRSSELASERGRALEALQQTCNRQRRGELEALIASLEGRLAAAKYRR